MVLAIHFIITYCIATHKYNLYTKQVFLNSFIINSFDASATGMYFDMAHIVFPSFTLLLTLKRRHQSPLVLVQYILVHLWKLTKLFSYIFILGKHNTMKKTRLSVLIALWLASEHSRQPVLNSHFHGPLPILLQSALYCPIPLKVKNPLKYDFKIEKNPGSSILQAYWAFKYNRSVIYLKCDVSNQKMKKKPLMDKVQDGIKQDATCLIQCQVITECPDKKKALCKTYVLVSSIAMLPTSNNPIISQRKNSSLQNWEEEKKTLQLPLQGDPKYTFHKTFTEKITVKLFSLNKKCGICFSQSGVNHLLCCKSKQSVVQTGRYGYKVQHTHMAAIT